jgi:predicted RNA binding protein YcfA (HicA-like mRNA interferase family)
VRLGRLYGFKYREVVKKLRRAGFEFDRYAKGSHEIWRNPETGKRTTVPNHPGSLPEGTLRAIIRQAGIGINTFLEL